MTSSQLTVNKLIDAASKHHNTFINLLILIFFSLGLVGILNHAMWRDELNVWLIARDSKSLIDLFHNIKYEGHPGLWYLCLYFLNQFTHNPVLMQIFHLLLATGFVYIFIRFSPFKPLQKVLFSFGYLPFYEYLLISRNYAIGILLIFTFCASFDTRKKSYLFLSLILFLLANTNAYCFFISIALGATLIFEYSLGEKVTQSITASRKNFIGSIVIVALGLIISLLQLIPPRDSTLQGELSGWTLQFDIKHLANALTRIWNSYILIVVPADSRHLEVGLFAILSLGLLAFASILLIRKPVALFLYLFGTSEILLFTYIKFLGSARHYGHLYILLIISLWIASYYPKSNLFILPFFSIGKSFQKSIMTWIKFVEKHKTTFIRVILVAQLAAGLVAFSRDLLVPYSASREAAKFIQTQKLERMLIVGSKDYAVSPLSGYLNKKIYYPERNELGSFVLFNNKRKEVDSVAVLEQVSQLIRQNKQNILLVLNSELDTSRADLSVSPLSKFTKSLIFNEKYYLYLVSPLTKA
ncbi:MAG TPA: hypothetical protein V6D14_26800 [Coleofasciculaceae cyanobacterium]|jgi:hypothetical protein